MKKFLFLLVAIAPVVSTSAQAMVPVSTLQSFTMAFAPGAGATSSSSLPGGGNTIPLDCNYILDHAIADVKSGARAIDSVSSTLLVGETAFAEASSSIVGGGGEGFSTYGGDASLAANKIQGVSHVAKPGATKRTDLAFTLSMVSGKAKMNWTFNGKSYVGNLDNCTSGYWTASASTSSIAVKMDVKVPAPPPE